MKTFLGVDVGGTNTDAVLISDEKEVLFWAKETTSSGVTKGVRDVVKKILDHLGQDVTSIQRISLGTTHFLNAVIQRKSLVPVSVIRLCGPASSALPPFIDVKEDIKSVIQGKFYLLSGGYYVDGTVFTELIPDEVYKVATQIMESGIRNIVVSGIYSPLNGEQERRTKEILLEVIPHLSITMSHEIGHMGLLERENAAILNECLKPLCRRVLSGLRAMLTNIGLNCPLYLTQNDGTLVSLKTCLSFPVYTFASGATNSMRGASFLAQKSGDSNEKLLNAMVVDIGGTSSDVGQLINGFPRAAPSKLEIGGVFTNFRMPELLSIGLGGGSLVRKSADKWSVGPNSVGCNLIKEARSKNGTTLTATDILVKLEILKDFGDPFLVDDITVDEADEILLLMKEMIEGAVDRMKVSRESIPLIVVGGGGILLKKFTELTGVSDLFFPENYQVANAVGAALAQVSGTCDRVVTNLEREKALNLVKEVAIKKAYESGAKQDTIKIVELSEIPISYLPGNAVRYIVKAAGELDVTRLNLASTMDEDFNSTDEVEEALETIQSDPSIIKEETMAQAALRSFPYQNGTSDTWTLDIYDIEALSVGAGILGCGGGGSSYLAKLRAKEHVKKGKVLKVVKPESIGNGYLAFAGFMGAPTVKTEKLMNGKEITSAIQSMETILQVKCSAIISCEIAGCNAIEPLSVAAELDLPVVDADGMGRAFPELQMIIPFILGHGPTPAVLHDEKSLSFATMSCASPMQLENIFRISLVNFMGCSGAVAFNPIPGPHVKDKCVLGSYSRAWNLGHCVLEAKINKSDPTAAILQHEKGSQILAKGKIVDIERKTDGAFDKGIVSIQKFEEEEESDSHTRNDSHLKIDFQNENLIATSFPSQKILATTPNLIVLLELESGLALQTEDLKFGLRVAAIKLMAPDILMSEKVLPVVDPRAFGYKIGVH